MTKLNEIRILLESLIPEDMRASGLIEDEMLKVGVIDACSSLNISSIGFVSGTKYASLIISAIFIDLLSCAKEDNKFIFAILDLI